MADYNEILDQERKIVARMVEDKRLGRLTGADYARTYRNKQREKLERYEAALREIAKMQPYSDPADAAPIALRALHIEV